MESLTSNNIACVENILFTCLCVLFWGNTRRFSGVTSGFVFRNAPGRLGVLYVIPGTEPGYTTCKEKDFPSVLLLWLQYIGKLFKLIFCLLFLFLSIFHLSLLKCPQLVRLSFASYFPCLLYSNVFHFKITIANCL